MKKKIVFALPENEIIARKISDGLNAEWGIFELHEFPDGETYVRVQSDCQDKEVMVICSLNHPNEKIVPLIFLAKLLRELHCHSITLVAPYLGYMRQDKAFLDGEAITSQYFGELLTNYFNKLITVDPHIHRWHSLNDIYKMKCTLVHAAPAISKWIQTNISNALLIGPDIESTQWISDVATMAGIPFIVASKQRNGDRDVEITLPNIQQFAHCTPVILDDIISSATTMINTAAALQGLHSVPPICIGVHAVFSVKDYLHLKNQPIAKVVTCNSILHESNGIDLSSSLIAAIQEN